MGDRVAEYLNFTIMIVMMVAVIALGASFMYLGRKMQNMFFDKVATTYATTDVGMMYDMSNKDYEEMPSASVLSLIYSNQNYIYDIYDFRDIQDREYVTSKDAQAGEVIGAIRKTKHLNMTGRDTSTTSDDTREKVRVATSYFTEDLNKSVKVVVKNNSLYSDYYDIYLHDLDCRNVSHTEHYCKKCKNVEHANGNCAYTYTGVYEDIE